MSEHMNDYKDYADSNCAEEGTPMSPMYPQMPGMGEGMYPPGMWNNMPYPPMGGCMPQPWPPTGDCMPPQQQPPMGDCMPRPWPPMGDCMPQPYPPMGMMPEAYDKKQLCYLEQMNRYMAHMCEAEACRCKAMQHMMPEEKC